MAKSLRTLSNQLRRNHGVLLVPAFDAGVRPGSVLHVRRWNDIDRIGHLDDVLSAGELPAVEGPVPCLLADFTRGHELSVEAAVDLLRPSAAARPRFNKAREARATFDSPVIYGMSLFDIEDAVREHPTIWRRALGRALGRARTRVAYQVIRGKLTLLFRGSGELGLDVRGVVGSLREAGLSGTWSWRNESMLESRRELTLAVETARWAPRRRRFLPMRAKL